MHEMHDGEELNITVREAIAKRDVDVDVNDEVVAVVVAKEEVDDDDEEDHHNFPVEDVVDDEDGHHEVDSDGDNHEHKQKDVNRR
jgi:hypothetical protein